VANDEPDLLQLLADVLALADEVTWAVDIADGAALLIALLVNHGPELLYIPGRAVNGATDGYRGEGKTDARDAFVIADQALCRLKIRFGTVSCGDAVRLGGVVVLVDEAVEDGLSSDSVGLEVGDGCRGGRFGAFRG
jgi:hypothetical protein